VNAFLRQAEEIFATAGTADAEDADLAVLVDHAGCIQVLVAGGWDTEALRVDRGARSVYRISRSAGRVRLEGRTTGQRCLLESAHPSGPFKSWQYQPMSINAGQDFPQEFIMDITPVNWSLDKLSTANGPGAVTSAQDREVVRAVGAVNKAGLAGDDRQLVFQRDAQTQKMVIRLVDRNTSEVISQIPPEYVLRLAEDLKAPKSVSTFG
jgi:uncharacterized FlaG/YvyC family protein